MTLPRPLSLVLLLALACPAPAGDIDKLKVGVQPDGRVVVPTNQILKPAGKQLTFPGRPTALLLIEDGKTLAVQNKNGLVFIDTATETIAQTLTGPGMSVTGLAASGGRVYVSCASVDEVRFVQRQGGGAFVWGRTKFTLTAPKVGGPAHPAGLAFEDDNLLWVASTRGNNVQRIDTKSGKVVQVIDVGVAPFGICFVGKDRAYVSNWGGEHPKDGDPTGVSSKTPVQVDPRTWVANDGSVTVIERIGGTWKKTGFIKVGLHPCALVASPKGGFLYVANASSDTVSIINTKENKVVHTINCRPEHRLPFGSGCNALALVANGSALFVANGSNNCVVVVRLGRDVSDTSGYEEGTYILGLIPTGWYPGGIQHDGAKLYVANVKGHGSVGPMKKGAKGHNSHDHLGSVSIVGSVKIAEMPAYTRVVNDNNRLSFSLMGLEKPRPDAKPVPLPQRHGEPSVFKHVVYIIKENRTYDQVFGDMKEGNGDPKLVMFGADVTPNLHRLARQFTLFDNFYCSGVLSADGHSWCNEAYVTDYLERSFGTFIRSYPYEGSDNLAFAPSGFLWDNALAHKKTLRNYGEFAKTTYTPKTTWTEVYNDFKNGTNKVRIDVKPNWKTLEPYTHPHFPGFPLTTPDVYRARMFLDEFKQFEAKGDFPNLVYLFLPNDHTSGTTPGFPTPRAMVADNDLAVGQIVEAISKSKFWKETCIFIVEDDPQNGFDHVDGHRTVAFVISPYTKRQFVDSTNYNQTGMVRTIELILGLPPMNQLDLSATPMRHCFQDKPDLTPYTAEPNKVPLDEMNPAKDKLKGKALAWAEKAIAMQVWLGDQADEDTFNRMLWFATRGEEPYPERYIGRRAPGRERVDVE
jgi:YVTN family beta-propeller protein